MLEMLLAFNIAAGKVETGPGVFEWDFVTRSEPYSLIHVTQTKEDVKLNYVK